MNKKEELTCSHCGKTINQATFDNVGEFCMVCFNKLTYQRLIDKRDFVNSKSGRLIYSCPLMIIGERKSKGIFELNFKIGLISSKVFDEIGFSVTDLTARYFDDPEGFYISNSDVIPCDYRKLLKLFSKWYYLVETDQCVPEDKLVELLTAFTKQ